MKNPSFITGLFLCLAAVSCERIKPKPPEATTLDAQLDLPASTVVIPVYYHVDSLEATINNKVKGTFIQKWITVNGKGDSLYLEVTKKGKVEIQWKGQTLLYTFPVSISGKFIKHIAGRKVKVKNAEPVTMELVLHMATRVRIGKDWNLLPTSELQKITWIKEPVLKVAMVKVNLRKKVEQALELNKAVLISKLDEALHERLATRKVIEKIWNDIQKPIQINKKRANVWLKPQGHDLKARLTKVDNFIALQVELSTYLRTILEGEAMPPSNATLPAYKPRTSQDDSLTLFILATIPFQKANELLQQELHDYKIEVSGYSTTLKDIEVYGTQEGLAVKLRLRGDVNGNVYMQGKLFYDTVLSHFAVKDFGFDVESENALLNSANWLLHDDALAFLQKKLEIDTQPLIDQLPSVIENAIEKGKTGEKINLQINELRVKPQQILIARSNIQVLLKASGKASIGLEKKVFAGRQRKKTKRL